MAIHALVLGAALSAVGFESVQSVTGPGYSALVKSVGEELPEYERGAAQRPAGQTLEAFDRAYLARHPLAAGTSVLIALPGQPVAGSPKSAFLLGSQAVQRWLARPPSRSTLTEWSSSAGHFLLLGSPIQEGGRSVGSLVASSSLLPLDQQRGRMISLAVGESLLVLAVALAAAYLLLRRLLRTVSSITATAEEIGSGSLDRRIDYQGPDDEVGTLARTFDRMLDRLSASFRAQRELVADVSHQLRSPLTAIRGHLELLKRYPEQPAESRHEELTLVIDELDRTTALVERMLLLGRALEADFVEANLVDLRTFMGDLRSSCRRLADRRWTLAPVPDAVLRIDSEKVRGALLNLAANSVAATAPGDEITLGCEVGEEVVFFVSDHGQGIPAGEQGQLFERFRRGLGAKGQGSGLGLAIVRAVAEAHGGRAELQSRPGEGTTVRVVLPATSIQEPDPDRVDP